MKRRAIAKLSCCGMTKSNAYDIISEKDNFIQIVLDDGSVAYRLKTAFDIIECQ